MASDLGLQSLSIGWPQAERDNGQRNERLCSFTPQLLSHCGRSPRLQDPLLSPLPPSHLPLGAAGPTPMQAVWTQAFPSSPPHQHLSAQACPPQPAAPSPATCPGSGSSLGFLLSVPPPTPFRAPFLDRAQRDPFSCLDLALIPDLISTCPGHRRTSLGTWPLALSSPNIILFLLSLLTPTPLVASPRTWGSQVPRD